MTTPDYSLTDVLAIYKGSDGEATKALYARLAAIAGVGALAVNLFRAQKSSERAKVYRGGIRGRGSYSRVAYDRKQWALDNLCAVLAICAEDAKITWGWGEDPKEPVHRFVLYVELPTGQVSFHTGTRGAGPDYPGGWDGQPGRSADRILRWIGRLLEARTLVHG